MIELNALKNKLDNLKKTRDRHPIWSNPLLLACKEGSLTFSDFQYLFSQYYLYSKNFSRLLAAVMVNCDNDYYRSKLAENLFEESGEKELEKRHAEIFRQFLQNNLKIPSLVSIRFERFTEEFVDEYLRLALKSPALESASALSLGTEGIISALYSIFKEGLIAAGFIDHELDFFNIHIACDDVHAETLEEILLFYAKEDPNLIRASIAMNDALDLRDHFFRNIYQQIINRRMMTLSEKINHRPEMLPEYPVSSIKSTIFLDGNVLYKSNDNGRNISFSVKRIPFNADVLDPRMVSIPAGHSNEYHQHAHETVLLFMKGEGEVIIEDQVIPVNEGDIVYVPRWVNHQTHNSGIDDMNFFAVTDYGLTRRIPSNSEDVYRLKKVNVLA